MVKLPHQRQRRKVLNEQTERNILGLLVAMAVAVILWAIVITALFALF